MRKPNKDPNLLELTYQYRIEPSQEIKNILAWTANELRKLYNHFLKQYRKEDKQISKLEPKEQRREWSKLLDKQQKKLVDIKKQNPKLYNIQSQVLHDIPYRLLPLIWNGFLTKRKELKKLKKRWRYPREKKSNSFSHIVFPQEKVSGIWVYKIEDDKLLIKQGSAVEQSKRELTLKLKYHRPIEGKVKTLTIAWKNGKYYANFSCKLPKTKQLTIQEIQRQIGIDIGVINFFATSEGWKYKNPQLFAKIAGKLKKLYQSLSRKRQKRDEDDLTEKSKNFEKARLKLMKAFRRVVCRINDLNHKLSRKIVDKFDLIAYENLKLSKAFEKQDKKRKFSKYTIEGLSRLRIADFFAKLDYKAKLKGKITYPVNPVDTSKRCFKCGKINQDLEKQRWFICADCPYSYEADRDINASKNILYKAQTELGTLSSERI